MDHLIACRMATYRDCQDAAWAHLPEVGIRYLETWLPAPNAVDTLRRKLGDSGLTLVMLDGKCDITADNHAERLAGPRQVKGYLNLPLAPGREFRICWESAPLPGRVRLPGQPPPDGRHPLRPPRRRRNRH